MTNQNKDISVKKDLTQDNIRTEKVTTNQVLISFGKNVRTKEVQNKEIDWDEFVNDFIFRPKEHVISYDNRKRDEKTFKFVYDNNKIVELDHLEAIKQLISIEKKTNLPYFVGGHFEPAQRNNKNLQFRSLLVLDIDKYPEGIEQLELKLEHGYCYQAFSIFNEFIITNYFTRIRTFYTCQIIQNKSRKILLVF